MKLRVEIPPRLYWRCPNPRHTEVVGTPNPSSPPICLVPLADWVCSVVMITVEAYDRQRRKS